MLIKIKHIIYNIHRWIKRFFRKGTSTIKPSGSSSTNINSSSGLHPFFGQYYTRQMKKHGKK